MNSWQYIIFIINPPEMSQNNQTNLEILGGLFCNKSTWYILKQTNLDILVWSFCDKSTQNVKEQIKIDIWGICYHKVCYIFSGIKVAKVNMCSQWKVTFWHLAISIQNFNSFSSWPIIYQGGITNYGVLNFTLNAWGRSSEVSVLSSLPQDPGSTLSAAL